MSEDKYFNKRKEKSFDYVSEGAKQFITLAAGIIAFTVTFSKDALASQKAITDFSKYILIVVWIYLFISVVAGLMTIYMLTGQLTKYEESPLMTHNPVIKKSPVRFWMTFQQLAFITGMFYASLFGALNLSIPYLSEWASYLSGGIGVFLVIVVPPVLIGFLLNKITVSQKEEKKIKFFAYLEKKNFESIEINKLLKSNVKLSVEILQEKPNTASHMKLYVKYTPAEKK
jgi:hypothetical protein